MDHATFTSKIAELLYLDVADLDLSPTASLYNDWALDSLSAFQLIVLIEALAGADVPPAQIPDLYTVGDAYTYFVSLRGSDST